MAEKPELLLDKTRTYAIALEGGGARGAYQIGVWRALEEAGIKYNAVSGSSVGALNGALMTMRDLELARQIWGNIRYSMVMDVDDRLMKGFFDRSLKLDGIRSLARYALDAIRAGGIDVTPLRDWINSTVDEERVRSSDVELFAVTYSLSEMKELDINIRELPEGQIGEMLLASAYFPAFKNEKIRGKRYSDGGVQDVVPINSLISRGYRDLIVIRIFGVGVEKRVRIPNDVSITTIAPTEELGSVLDFNSEHAEELMTLGYYDAHRVLYGYVGSKYYLQRTMSEAEAYELVRAAAYVSAKQKGEEPTLREVNEDIIPAMAKRLGAKSGDYYSVLLHSMEKAALERGLPRYRLITDRELLSELAQPEQV